ncbi:GH19544, partial [Drosophila grimshawi]
NKYNHYNYVCMVLFSYGGMDMAQGLGWNMYTGNADTQQFSFSWFIGFIIGAVLGALAVTHVAKFYFYCVAIVTNLVDAIICVSAPYNYDAMVAARYIGGIGIGFATIAFLIHNSEAAPDTARGKWCAVEQSGMGLGIAVQVIMDSDWNPYNNIAANQVHGIIGIVFSLVAIGILILSVESPIYHLRRNNYNEASDCQWQLLEKKATSKDYDAAFEEKKTYVSEGVHESIGHDLAVAVVPFIKMLICRCLVAFSFSIPLTQTIIASTIVWQGTMYAWPIIVWRVLRFLGTIIGIVVMDFLGRKLLTIVGLACMGGLMLGMASIYSNVLFTISTYYMGELCRISMVFQMFAGLFVACTPAYLGEAFPMRIKPFLIALIVIIEQLIHIIVICTFKTSLHTFYQYYLAVGIILLVCMVFLLITLPETKKTTLREAGHRFRRLHDIFAH